MVHNLYENGLKPIQKWFKTHTKMVHTAHIHIIVRNKDTYLLEPSNIWGNLKFLQRRIRNLVHSLS